MFAVIKTGGKQYRVAADQTVKIEKIAGEPGDITVFDTVLMVGEGESATIGTPVVEGASVAAEIVTQDRDRKIIIFKKRRRQNSRRTNGHRQWHTTVRISEILTDGAKPSKKAAAKKPAAEKPATAAKEAKKETKADTAKADAPKAAAPKAKPAAEPKAEAAAAPLFKAPKGKGDDLTTVKGIGPVAAGQLNEQGITTFAQIAALSDAEVETIDAAMPFSADQIKDWREQAADLAKK